MHEIHNERKKQLEHKQKEKEAVRALRYHTNIKIELILYYTFFSSYHLD